MLPQHCFSPVSSIEETRFCNQSFIRTVSGAFFLGATGACASSAGSSVGATDAGASSAGRGRGNGGDDAARCCLVAVPVTWLNQVEMCCAIADKGEPALGCADGGACAWSDAAASAGEIERIWRSLGPSPARYLPAAARMACARRLTRIRAVLRHPVGISVLTRYSEVEISWRRPASKYQTLQLSLSLRRLQLVFAYNPLMWFLTAFHPILEATIALGQLLGDNVFTSRNIPISGAQGTRSRRPGICDPAFARPPMRKTPAASVMT